MAARHFAEATNMTDELAALSILVYNDAPGRFDALDRFYDRWRNDPLVLGKWFSVQATSPIDSTIEIVDGLTRHPAFEWRNPNKFRALIGAFAMANQVNFHRIDGAGYRFVADWLLKLDPINPQTTAKVLTAFETWRWYDERRQTMMRGELERIRDTDGLSRDSKEIVVRLLK